MKRNDFINVFNSFYLNKYNMLETSIDIVDEKTKDEIIDIIVKNIPFSLTRDQRQFFLIKEDWDYMTDDPETDDWRYNITFDINKLYDSMQFDKGDIQNIYRLCNKEGTGIYNMGIGFKYLNSNQGSPFEDENFRFIFPNISYKSEYQKQWKFACENEEQLKLWLDKDENIKNLSDNGVFLAVITIPENFIIKGKEQVIFNENFVEKIEYKALNTLVKNDKKIYKPKF